MSPDPDFQILRQIVELPVLLFLAFVAGGVLRMRWRRAGSSVVIASAAILYAASTPVASTALLRTLDWQFRNGELDAANVAAPPGAIVILSANAYPTVRGMLEVGPLTLERLVFGIRLKRETELPVLVSGGVLRNFPESLAAAMARTLTQDFREPPTWLEDRSQTTAENARFSAKLLAAEGIESVYLVTHVWHMARSATAFRHAGLAVVPRPIALPHDRKRLIFADFLPNARAFRESQLAMHEWTGLVWYGLIDYCEVTGCGR
jgi:uncharacterized SAM-binding protein YcdF (DUF218 family)